LVGSTVFTAKLAVVSVLIGDRRVEPVHNACEFFIYIGALGWDHLAEIHRSCHFLLKSVDLYLLLG
jgi:hypothetical protein